jgi:hypothetical protein
MLTHTNYLTSFLVVRQEGDAHSDGGSRCRW